MPSYFKLKSLCVSSMVVLLSACGGGGGGSSSSGGGTASFDVALSVGAGGSTSVSGSQSINQGATLSFTVTADAGFSIDSASGCGGSLNGQTFTTGAISSACTVSVSFLATPPSQTNFAVMATAGAGGSISPASTSVVSGNTTSFALSANSGFSIAAVTGCGGSLSGNTYTTAAISADCSVAASFTNNNSGQSQSVVYRMSRPAADPAVDPEGISDLFAVAKDSSNHVMLNSTLVDGGDIQSFAWSPSGNHIAYFGDQDTDDVNELYSVAPNASGRIKLNGALTSGGDVLSYQWSPDGMKLAYLANQETFDKIELFVVDADGQNRAKLNTALVSGGNVEEFLWSSDSNHIAYKADLETNDVVELYKVAADATNHQKVNSALTATKSLIEYRWSPLDNYISYVAGEVITGVPTQLFYDLFTYELTSNTTTQVSLVSGRAGTDYIWSASESALVFSCAKPRVGGVTHTCAGIDNLYRVQPDGQQLTQIPVTPTSSTIVKVFGFVNSSEDILSVTLDGTTPSVYVHDQSGTQLDFETPSNLNSNSTAIATGIKVSPDGSKAIVYAEDTWVYDLSSQTLITIADNGSSSFAQEVDWAADSNRFYYNVGFFEPTNLKIASANGSGIVDSTNFFSESTSRRDYEWVGNALVFATTRSIVGNGSINIVDSLGANLLTLSQAFTGNPSTEIGTLQVSSLGTYVVYDVEGANNPFSAALNNEGEAIYAVDIDGSNHVQLNAALPFGSEIREYGIKPE